MAHCYQIIINISCVVRAFFFHITFLTFVMYKINTDWTMSFINNETVTTIKWSSGDGDSTNLLSYLKFLGNITNGDFQNFSTARWKQKWKTNIKLMSMNIICFMLNNVIKQSSVLPEFKGSRVLDELGIFLPIFILSKF